MPEWLSDPKIVGPIIALLAAAIGALLRGTVVTAGHHTQVLGAMQVRIDELVKDKNEFKDIALRSADTADRALKVAAADRERRDARRAKAPGGPTHPTEP